MVDAAVMKKYIMFCGINSKYFRLGASFIVGSNPTFSACGCGSSGGRARKRKTESCFVIRTAIIKHPMLKALSLVRGQLTLTYDDMV